MRIEDLKGPRPQTATRRSSAASSGSRSTFATLLSTAEEEAASGTAAPSLVGSVMLPLIDEVDSEARRHRRQAVRHGSDLLDRLEEIRLGLLEGRISPERIGAMVQALRGPRSRCDDEALEALLADIELRAEVEIAKLEYR